MELTAQRLFYVYKALLSFCSLPVITSIVVDGGTQKLLCAAHILSISQEQTYMPNLSTRKCLCIQYDVVNIQLKMASEYLISNNSYIQNKATMATKELLTLTQWE